MGDVCKIIKTLTAIVKIYEKDNYVIKTFTQTLKDINMHSHCKDYPCACGGNINSIFHHEIEKLKELCNYGHFPKIIDTDEKTYSFKMTYCGKSLSELHKSGSYEIVDSITDLEEQIIKISDILDKCFIQHYDLGFSNICILHNKIFIIDFVCNNISKDNFIEGQNLKRIQGIFNIFKDFKNTKRINRSKEIKSYKRFHYDMKINNNGKIYYE